MPPQVTTTLTVQVSFTVTDPDRADGLSFTDALYYPVGQVPAAAVIRTAAVARYVAWRAITDTRPPPLTRAQRLQAAQDAAAAADAAQQAADAALATAQADPSP